MKTLEIRLTKGETLKCSNARCGKVCGNGDTVTLQANSKGNPELVTDTLCEKCTRELG